MGIQPNNILTTVRGFFKNVLEKMMLEERTIFLESKSDTKANGYYERKINSIYGEVPDLQIPRSRDSSFQSVLLPKGKVDSQLAQIIIQLYSVGVSTRKMESVLRHNLFYTTSQATARGANILNATTVAKWDQKFLEF